MGKEIISGEDFYTTVVDMGEEIEFLTNPVVKQYASITAYRSTGTTNLTDGIYQYRGVMTFGSVEQQKELLGEYFKRQTNKAPVNILTGILPENTTHKIGSVYAVECNEKVDIISHYDETEKDEYGDTIKTPVYLAKNVDCYITVTQRQLTEQTPGSFVATVTNLLIPAKYKLSVDNIIVKKGFVFDDYSKENDYIDIKYRIESIDTSLMDVIYKETEVEDEEGNIEFLRSQKFVGILKCTLTEDKS